MRFHNIRSCFLPTLPASVLVYFNFIYAKPPQHTIIIFALNSQLPFQEIIENFKKTFVFVPMVVF